MPITDVNGLLRRLPLQSRRKYGLFAARSGNPATGNVVLCLPGYASSGIHQFAGLYRPGFYSVTTEAQVLVHERPDGPEFSFDTEGAAVAQVLERLAETPGGVTKLIVIGHSMGAISGLRVIDAIRHHPMLGPALKAGKFIALSSPLTGGHVRMPLNYYQIWRWPRPVTNDLLQWAYMRGTGYRCERYAMQAAAVACYRQNVLSNAGRRAQLRALLGATEPAAGTYAGVPLAYLQAEHDPLVAPAAAEAYCRAFGVQATDHVEVIPGAWHGETVGQPTRWLPAIRRAIGHLGS